MSRVGESESVVAQPPSRVTAATADTNSVPRNTFFAVIDWGVEVGSVLRAACAAALVRFALGGGRFRLGWGCLRFGGFCLLSAWFLLTGRRIAALLPVLGPGTGISRRGGTKQDEKRDEKRGGFHDGRILAIASSRGLRGLQLPYTAQTRIPHRLHSARSPLRRDSRQRGV